MDPLDIRSLATVPASTLVGRDANLELFANDVTFALGHVQVSAKWRNKVKRIPGGDEACQHPGLLSYVLLVVLLKRHLLLDFLNRHFLCKCRFSSIVSCMAVWTFA
jgi:hypothetical protein